MFKITQAKFLLSASNSDKSNIPDLPEFAFVGRSNVGKSSLINKLTNQKNLAKTSSTPGRTRLVNYFLINNGQFLLVDLPGYGFSKAGKQHESIWSTLMEDYLNHNNNLKLVFLLVDLRHEPSALDKQMMTFLFVNQIPFKIIATKSDKIAKSKISSFVQTIATSLRVGKSDIIPVSNFDNCSCEKLILEIEKNI